jgi:hypothetical protein
VYRRIFTGRLATPVRETLCPTLRAEGSGQPSGRRSGVPGATWDGASGPRRGAAPERSGPACGARRAGTTVTGIPPGAGHHVALPPGRPPEKRRICDS